MNVQTDRHPIIDPARFTSLALSTIPILTMIARQSLDDCEIEDAVQETIARAWEHLHAYKQHKGSFETWTKAIMKNVIWDIRNDPYKNKTIPIEEIIRKNNGVDGI